MEMTDHPGETLAAAYVDGTLDPESRAAVGSHPASCASCRAGVGLLISAVDREGSPASFEIVTPAPDSVLRAEGIEFRWSAVEGADRYAVTILSSAGDRIVDLQAVTPATVVL